MIKHGFTLLELLLATVLLTLLMLGVTAIITNLGATKTTVFSEPTRPDLVRSFLDVLRMDLNSAEHVDSDSPNSITIDGYAAGLSSSQESIHLPARITYGVVTVGDRSWVVRSETRLDRSAAGTTRHDLVEVGISGFQVVPIEPDPEGARLDSGTAAAGSPTNRSDGEESQAGLGAVKRESPIDEPPRVMNSPAYHAWYKRWVARQSRANEGETSIHQSTDGQTRSAVDELFAEMSTTQTRSVADAYRVNTWIDGESNSSEQRLIVLR